MELVGKKFRVKDDWEDAPLYTIEKSTTDIHYKITWMDSDEDEVEEQFAVYSKSDVEEYIADEVWILENE